MESLGLIAKWLQLSNLQWAAPRELNFESNVSDNYKKFEEHWSLFEKTKLCRKSMGEKCFYFLLCIGEFC